MEIKERHSDSKQDEYSYEVVLKFDDPEANSEFTSPVNGSIRVELTDEFSYPVEIDFKPDMISGENDDAAYVEFEISNKIINSYNESPVEFSFVSGPAPPSERFGAKVYSFKSSEYDPKTDTDAHNDPEIIEHHMGVPSAQRVHLIEKTTDAIFRGVASSDDIQNMINVYNADRSSSVEKFYTDIKKYTDFETQIKVLDFFIECDDMYRDHSATVNKVAKQVIKQDLRCQVDSVNDIRNFVSIVNSEENHPNITVGQVFDKVYQRADGNKDRLRNIAEDLGLDSWPSSAWNLN